MTSSRLSRLIVKPSCYPENNFLKYFPIKIQLVKIFQPQKNYSLIHWHALCYSEGKTYNVPREHFTQQQETKL